MIRKMLATLAVTAGLLTLSAVPAQARPVLDDTTYRVVCTTFAWPVGRVCYLIRR
jgi:hypothetical protein